MSSSTKFLHRNAPHVKGMATYVFSMVRFSCEGFLFACIVLLPSILGMSLFSEIKRCLWLPLPAPNAQALLIESAFLGFYTAVFLVVFQPFGTYEAEMSYKIERLLGYGGVVFVVYFPVKLSFAQVLLPNGGRWWQEAIMLFLVGFIVIFCCFLYYQQLIYPGISWKAFPSFFWFSLLIFILPYGILLYGKLTKAIRIDEARQKTEVVGMGKPEPLTLLGNNQAERFHFQQKDIIYLQSSGNYVEVFFIKDGQLHSVLIRNTLSGLKEQLPKSDFNTVHRSFVVHRTHFNQLKKEKGKTWLMASKLMVEVPVSRTYQTEAEQIVKDFR